MIQVRINGNNWTDEPNPRPYIEQVLAREVWYAPRIGREPMTTHEQVLEMLATGKELKYDDDWYATLRDGNIAQQNKQRMMEQQASDPKRYPNGRVLDCGHTVYHADHVMSASHGTSCTDCYDRMS